MENAELAIDEDWMLEAALIRAKLTDEEWADLLQYRPSLEASLAAYRKRSAASGA